MTQPGITDALDVVASAYGLTASELHDMLISRRTVDALCAAVDLAVLRGQLDARSLIADARLCVADPDCPDDVPELLRRLACTRPAHERDRIEAEHGRLPR